MRDWREHPVDGGVLQFDRRTGLNVLRRGPSTTSVRRVAPRVLQIGLLTPCNLKCSFCYRDTKARSVLTAPFLLDLLERASEWGVLEVAFGGGEPLLFAGFTSLVRELHRRTPLGINVTTNGTLLTPAILEELGDACGEIRVSAYSDNHYRRTLRLLAGRQFGVNWLITPQNVGMLEPTIHDFVRLGARNILLLGYKGMDPSLHLRKAELDRLRSSINRLRDLPLRLDICWYPLLPEVPHLFARPDCGAGDDFLVVTPDRAVQPCSFHHERIPFDTFDELRAIYERLRDRRPSARITGCTRDQFIAMKEVAEPPEADGVWVWHARAANNSGDWTIVARFNDPADAARVANELRELSRQQEAFLSSNEGEAFVEANGYDGTIPTPPLRAFAERHGFEWPEHGGLWWEENGYGAPVLTAGVVADAVVVFHPYCMGLDENAFRTLFAKNGARQFGYFECDRPAIVVTARGTNDLVPKLIEDYLAKLATFEYAYKLKEAPPWGAHAEDPRVLEDEDRSARLTDGKHSITREGELLHLRLTLENTYAGAVAIETWLKQRGYTDVEVRIDDVLAAMPPSP